MPRLETDSTQLVYFLDQNDLKKFPQEDKPGLKRRYFK